MSCVHCLCCNHLPSLPQLLTSQVLPPAAPGPVQVQHQHALAVAHSRGLLDAAALALGVEALDGPAPAATTQHLHNLQTTTPMFTRQQQAALSTQWW